MAAAVRARALCCFHQQQCQCVDRDVRALVVVIVDSVPTAASPAFLVIFFILFILILTLFDGFGWYLFWPQSAFVDCIIGRSYNDDAMVCAFFLIASVIYQIILTDRFHLWHLQGWLCECYANWLSATNTLTC
jgi:hypothetical protein